MRQRYLDGRARVVEFDFKREPAIQSLDSAPADDARVGRVRPVEGHDQERGPLNGERIRVVARLLVGKVYAVGLRRRRLDLSLLTLAHHHRFESGEAFFKRASALRARLYLVDDIDLVER